MNACGVLGAVGYILQGDIDNAIIEGVGALAGGAVKSVIKTAWRAVSPGWRVGVQKLNPLHTTRNSLAKGDRALMRAADLTSSYSGTQVSNYLREQTISQTNRQTGGGGGAGGTGRMLFA